MIDGILAQFVETIKNKTGEWCDRLYKNFDFEGIEKELSLLVNDGLLTKVQFTIDEYYQKIYRKRQDFSGEL